MEDPRGFNLCVTTNYRNSGNATTFIPGGETILSMFRCPSSTLPAVAPATFQGYDYGDSNSDIQNVGYATSDYKACVGKEDFGLFVKARDAASSGRALHTKIRDVTDGTSNTIAIGESAYAGKDGDNFPVWIGITGRDERQLFKTQFPSVINLSLIHI